MKFYRFREIPFLHPVVTFELTSVTVQGSTRRLRAAWTPELAQDVEYLIGMDAEAELTALLSEEVFQPRRGIMSRYATHMVNNRYYGKILVTKSGISFEENKFAGLRFGKLKALPLPTPRLAGSDVFEIVQFPIGRRVYSQLVANGEPRLDIIESNGGLVYASLRQWASLIDKQDGQPIMLSSRQRMADDDLVR